MADDFIFARRISMPCWSAGWKNCQSSQMLVWIKNRRGSRVGRPPEEDPGGRADSKSPYIAKRNIHDNGAARKGGAPPV